jgi:CheY-like chemotaxis protein
MVRISSPGPDDQGNGDQARIRDRRSFDQRDGSLTALLVDEDEDLRVYLRRCLEQFGPLFGRVLEASNGPEALAVIQIGSVDLLICGAQVSQMSSAALFSAIRADTRTASILIMQVANLEPESERSQRSSSVLVDAVLDSPFNAAGFADCLAGLMQSD